MPREPVIFAAMHTEAKAIRKGLGPEVPIRIIGIEGKKIPSPAELARPATIILAGFAGALDPSLKVGDLVLDTSLPLPNVPFRRGTVYASRGLVATSDEKAALFQSTGSLAVDMETAVVKALADRLGVPFIGLRVISDTAEESIDPRVLRFIDATGRVKPLALAATLGASPSLLATLLRLGRSARIASRNLSEAMPVLWGALRELESPIRSASPA